MFSETSHDSLKQFKPSTRALWVSLVACLVMFGALWVFANQLVRWVYGLTPTIGIWTPDFIASAQDGVRWVAIGGAVLMIVLTFFRSLSLWSVCYEITTSRLMYHHGILVRKHDEIELRRIRDFQVTQPLFSRAVGLGEIFLITRDETHPELKMGPFLEARAIQEEIRENVNRHQRETGYREYEGY